MCFWEGFCVFVYLDPAKWVLLRMILVYWSSLGFSADFFGLMSPFYSFRGCISHNGRGHKVIHFLMPLLEKDIVKGTSKGIN